MELCCLLLCCKISCWLQSRGGWRAGPAAEGGNGIWGGQEEEFGAKQEEEFGARQEEEFEARQEEEFRARQEEEYPDSFRLRACTKTQSHPCSQLTSWHGLVYLNSQSQEVEAALGVRLSPC